MTRAIVDPAELRRFASDLRQFDTQLREHVTRLNAQFQGLSETWRDQEHARFAELFQQTMQTLARFSTASREHIPFLVRKAEAAEEYLRRR